MTDAERRLVEEKCNATVYPRDLYGAFHGHQCSRKSWRDGRCKIHHPETVAARNKESDRKWRDKMDNSPLAKAMRKIDELTAEVERLRKGEYVCARCGLRKNDEHEKGEF